MSAGATRISVRVGPSAARNEVVDFAGGVWHIKVAAPPYEGRANRELTAFLSRTLDVGKGKISIIKGQISRNKVIAIEGLSQEEVVQRLLPQSDS